MPESKLLEAAQVTPQHHIIQRHRVFMIASQVLHMHAPEAVQHLNVALFMVE